MKETFCGGNTMTITICEKNMGDDPLIKSATDSRCNSYLVQVDLVDFVVHHSYVNLAKQKTTKHNT